MRRAPIMSAPRRQALCGMLAACGAAGIAKAMRAFAQEPEAPQQPDKSGAKSGSMKAWETLPPTPRWPKPDRSGIVPANGAQLFYAQFGTGPNVLLLHGGMGSSNYWGHLISALSPQYAVTALDTRGHGRSPFAAGNFSYKLFADDAAAALEALGMQSAAVVGWSDGAITALQMAVSRPAMVTRAFVFGGNISLNGYRAGGSRSPVFAIYSRRCRTEYEELSPHPERWSSLLRALAPLWRSEPGITRSQLSALKIPVTISDGQYDEIIKREHTEMMAKSIPGAELKILPEVSHFAMLQKPAEFNRAVIGFLSA